MKKIIFLLFLICFTYVYAEEEYGVSFIIDADPVSEPDKKNLKQVETSRKDNQKRVIKKVDTRVDETGMKHITYYYTDEFKYKFPFKAIYEKNGKTLIYVGVQHAKPETFQMVRAAFDEHNPEMVILEIEADRTMPYNTCMLMENYYAKNLAEQRKIKVVLSDPGLKATHKNFKKSEKFTPKDFQAYWIMRTAAINAAYGMKPEPLKQYLAYYAFKTGASAHEVLTEKQFMAWYKENFGKDYKLSENLGTDIFTAESPGNRNITNKIFTEQIYISRDPALIDNIYKAFQKYDTVLVIFGAAHWGTMEVVLKDMFGKPKVTTKVPNIETGLEKCPGYGEPPKFAL